MSEEKKTKAQLEAERLAMMNRAAIKHGLTCFDKGKYSLPPDELKEFWMSLDQEGWKNHLEMFALELKKYNSVGIKKLLFDLDHYVKDCRKMVTGFNRSKEEVLLMIAIGQLDPAEFLEHLKSLPSNRELLDRKIHKQIKELDWQDDLALKRLDELTLALDKPKIKKAEVDTIEKEIGKIEKEINARKLKRDELAIKLVEWKARGTIDIASGDDKFRLDA